MTNDGEYNEFQWNVRLFYFNVIYEYMTFIDNIGMTIKKCIYKYIPIWYITLTVTIRFAITFVTINIPNRFASDDNA